MQNPRQEQSTAGEHHRIGSVLAKLHRATQRGLGLTRPTQLLLAFTDRVERIGEHPVIKAGSPIV